MTDLENNLNEIKESIDRQTRLLNDIFHDNKNSQSEGYVVLDDNNNITADYKGHTPGYKKVDHSAQDPIVAIPNSTYIFNKIQDKLRCLHTVKRLCDDNYICSLDLDKRLRNTGYTTAILDTVFSETSNDCNLYNSCIIVSNESTAALLFHQACYLYDLPYLRDPEDIRIFSLKLLRNNPQLLAREVTHLFLDNSIKSLDEDDKKVLSDSGCDIISLHAWDSGKYKEVVYNEKRASVVELLQMLLNNDPQIDLNKYVYITREQFFDWRDNQPDSWERTLVLTAWSFSNNLKDYLWGKKVAPDKLFLTRALFFGDTGTQFDKMYQPTGTIAEKYSYFHKWHREKMNISSRYDQLQRLQRLQQLEQLQQILQLQQLERLKQTSIPGVTFIAGDYRDLDIQPNDVVYCDPPYINTTKDYGGFDFESFHDWYTSSPEDAYISEYTQLPDTEVYADLGKKISMTSTGKRRNELLLKVLK